MPKPLPYVVVPKNIEPLFARIAGAKVPDAFTHNFLNQTLGLKGSNDRALIPLLRALGFIDTTGKPLSEYSALKNEVRRRAVLGAAVKKAFAPLFEANEKANELSQDQLRGLVAQVAGTDTDLTSRIVSTFNALAKISDFDGAPIRDEGDSEQSRGAPTNVQPVVTVTPPAPQSPTHRGTQFHYNIQVHLPANATEEVYLNIFNALRKVFP